MEKIYLATPYSGMEESSYEQVTEAFGKLMMMVHTDGSRKYNVFSPITHCYPLTKLENVKLPGTWEYWETIDADFVMWADSIFVFIPKEGIEKVFTSTGVCAEVELAREYNKPLTMVTMINGELKFL